MELKDTIFLPKSEFPMKGNLPKKEPEILEYWNKIEIYKKLREKRKNCEKFILHDGPPFANGTPHAGTAMNKVLKDIIVKMKSLQGFDAPFVPGWDCHGLPIEWKIEEQLRAKSINKDDIAPNEFRNMCKDFALYWIDVQKKGFKRLGVFGDWDNPYLTMNKSSEGTVIRLLGKFLADGTLYRGEKPVFWSVVEKTALAEAEIEYKDKQSTSIYVAFKVKSSKIEFLKDSYIIIWTTTPWTLPGNRAISFSKEIRYCVANLNGRKIVLARELYDDFRQTTHLEPIIITEFDGKDLEGTICVHPFFEDGYDFDIPLIHGDHVEISSGTGLVHTAPGHGIDDYNVCKKNNIAVPKTVDESGIYYDSVPIFKGKHIFKVEPLILEKLENANALVFKTKIIHSYPHSWRSKAPLIFRTTPQWFISLDKTGIRKKAIEEIQKTNWIPKQGHNRIMSFVENRSDWCVSRQRLWGVPLPIFISKKTNEPLRDPKILEKIAQIIDEKGTNAWFSEPKESFFTSEYDINDFEQSFDTTDVWFESSSSYAYVLKANSDLKDVADIYLEGSDQHRGWFQHSLLVACGAYNKSPFKTVMTHGFIVDENGRKMSKSLGNVVTLDEVVEKLGSDIFRMWVSSSDFTQDLKLGINILKQIEDIYKKLRNTLKYILGAISDYSDEEKVPYKDLPDLERWILHKIFEINSELNNAINEYDINKYFSILVSFCVSDLSSFFFDIRKDTLYCDHKLDKKRAGYRSTLKILFEHLIRFLAPIMSYTAEEAWLCYNKKSYDSFISIHLEKFLNPGDWKDENLDQKMKEIKEIRKSITSALEIARKDKKIGSSLEARVIIFDPQKLLDKNEESLWEEIAITSSLEIRHEEITEEAFIGEKNIGVKIELAPGKKCLRCWKYTDKINENNICPRCQSVLDHLN